MQLSNSNNKKTQLKIGQGPEQTFLRRRYTNCQQVHEKMLNFPNHQGNANQNHNEISSHTC